MAVRTGSDQSTVHRRTYVGGFISRVSRKEGRCRSAGCLGRPMADQGAVQVDVKAGCVDVDAGAEGRLGCGCKGMQMSSVLSFSYSNSV